MNVLAAKESRVLQHLKEMTLRRDVQKTRFYGTGMGCGTASWEARVKEDVLEATSYTHQVGLETWFVKRPWEMTGRGFSALEVRSASDQS